MPDLFFFPLYMYIFTDLAIHDCDTYIFMYMDPFLHFILSYKKLMFAQLSQVGEKRAAVIRRLFFRILPPKTLSCIIYWVYLSPYV